MQNRLIFLSTLYILSNCTLDAMDRQRTPDEGMQQQRAQGTIAAGQQQIAKQSNYEEKEKKADEQNKAKNGKQYTQETLLPHNALIVRDGKQQVFNLTTIDAFSQQSFKKLILEQFGLNTPYIIVQVITRVDDKDVIHFFDAHQFNFHYFVGYGTRNRYPLAVQDISNQTLIKQNRSHNKEYKNILNNMPLTSEGINYFINSLGNPIKFNYICSHSDLFSGNNDRRNFWHTFMMANQNQDLKLHTTEQYNLGLYYHYGTGTLQNQELSLRILSTINFASLSNPQQKARIQYQVGIMYMDKSIEQEAIAQEYEAKRQNAAHANQVLMTKKYEEAGGFACTYANQCRKKAFDIFSMINLTQLLPAEKARVQYELAVSYLEGDIVPKDEKRAFDILSSIKLMTLRPMIKANAQYLLGMCYISRDKTKAFYLLSAIDLTQLLPDKKAHVQYELAISYHIGDCIPQNKQRSFRMLSTIDLEKPSADLKAQIQYQLSMDYYLGDGVDQDEKRAFDILSTIDLTNVLPQTKAYIQYNLALMHWEGHGTLKDEQKVFTLLSALDFDQLSAQHQASTQYMLNLIHPHILELIHRGDNAEIQTPDEYIKLLALAAQQNHDMTIKAAAAQTINYYHSR